MGAVMTNENSKILLAATALGLAALACSGSAEARPKDKGYSDQVVASDEVAPRHRARRHRRHNCDASADCGDDYFFANGYVVPVMNRCRITFRQPSRRRATNMASTIRPIIIRRPSSMPRRSCPPAGRIFPVVRLFRPKMKSLRRSA